jgi:phospholipid/cholesterol/gamma-HCH transport system substrate-binding protein
METKANYAAVGAFVLICVVGVVVTLLWLAGAQYSQEYEYFQTSFKGPVTGLGNGTTVRYNGIDVGRVTDLHFDPNDPQKVIAMLQVKPDLHIRQDSEASIESQGLTGGSYVEISGGTKKSPELVPAYRGQAPFIKSKPSTLQQLEQSAPELFDKLNRAADKINALLSPENVKNFSGILSNFNVTSKNLTEITTPLAKRSGDIDAIIANLSHASQKLQPTLVDADDSVKKFGKLSADADAFVNGEGLSQLSDLLREARGLVASLTRLSNELDRQPTKLLFGDRHKGYTPK